MLQPQIVSRRANLTFPQRYIISAAAMSALRSNYSRLTLLPLLLLVALLLPTLHLHSVYQHDDDGHLHQHPIIHTDFLSTAVQEHDHMDRESVVLSSRQLADFSQTNFSALAARGVHSLTLKLTHAPRFLVIDVEENNLRLVLLARVFKQEHPPPSLEVYRSSNAPRSPPVFA